MDITTFAFLFVLALVAIFVLVVIALRPSSKALDLKIANYIQITTKRD